MKLSDIESKSKEDLCLEIFGLNDLQTKIFEEIRDEKLTVKQVAERVDRSRSTTQRALKQMLDKDIIMREARQDKTIYYVYTTLPMKELSQAAQKLLEDRYEKASQKLD